VTNLLTPDGEKFAGLPLLKVSEQLPHINILIYGDSGVGKTRLAGSSDDVPAMRKVLVVDVEGGTFSLRKMNPNANIVRVKTWEAMQKLYDELLYGNHGFQTVVIDSLTEAQKFNMDDIMLKLIMDDSGRDPDIPSIREWGKNLNQIRKFVRAFRDLPMNTIFTALANHDKDRAGRPTNKPGLSGKLAGEVAAFLDVVVYMYKKEENGEQKHLLLTAATESTTAKDRSDSLPQIIVDPTMSKIYPLLIGEKDTKTA
jgi:phage nucleotide-binding protein